MPAGPLPGFRDFYPTELAERAFIFSKWREVARRYALVEIDGPPLEALELYTKKSGDEIVAQLYEFEDKGKRRVALRPEMTPTVARMVAARAQTLRKPVRWFSIPQLFRYERQQRGRLREHYQLNVDIIGESDVSADAELLACAIDMLRACGLTKDDIVVRFSDRRVLNAVLLAREVPEPANAAVYVVLDKFERQPESVSVEKLVAAGLTAAQASLLLADVRDSRGRGEMAGLISAEDPEGQFMQAWNTVQTFQTHVGSLLGDPPEDWLTFDLSIVRGLAYYTGLVFEIYDRRGELRAICGGGRYDSLLGAIGGVDLPALGFGMGDVVLAELLRNKGLLPAHLQRLDYWIAPGADDAETREAALSLTGRLRQCGCAVEYPLHTQTLSRQLKTAANAGARYVAIVHAPGETHDVTLRELGAHSKRSGERDTPLSFAELIDHGRQHCRAATAD